MPWRFGFRIGPFRYSERIGRTQAQKRAAARARAQRKAAEDQSRQAREDMAGRQRLAAMTPEEYGRSIGLSEEDIERTIGRIRRPGHTPEADAEIERLKKDMGSGSYEARTHRYVVSGCHLDPLKGGEFTLEADHTDQVHIKLDAKSLTHFLSLRNGDIVQVTFAPEQAGLEEFWHVSRANGARPRSPVELSADDMRWFGLTGTRSAEPPEPSG